MASRRQSLLIEILVKWLKKASPQLAESQLTEVGDQNILNAVRPAYWDCIVRRIDCSNFGIKILGTSF